MLKASKRAYEDFLKSSVWEDMKQWLTDRLMLVRNDLESDVPIEETQKLRGEAATLRSVLEFPERTVKEYDNLVSEKEEENG